MASEFKILSDNNCQLIIAFGGIAKQFGGVQPFEFLNFLNKNFDKCDKYFYIDKKCNRYHNGIENISNNIDETVDYLKKIILPYKIVTFIGVSAGGYAAILFGSLLNITNVIAFQPPTMCNMINDTRKFDNRYSDLLPLINKTTRYYLFGNLSIQNIYDSHHISHCNRLKIYKNVNVTEYKDINIREMRDNGELLTLFNSIIKL